MVFVQINQSTQENCYVWEGPVHVIGDCDSKIKFCSYQRDFIPGSGETNLIYQRQIKSYMYEFQIPPQNSTPLSICVFRLNCNI